MTRTRILDFPPEWHASGPNCAIPSQALLIMVCTPFGTVRRFLKTPVQTQARVLTQLLRKAAGTEWGRRFDFAEIARADDPVRAYQQAVPLLGYDDYREDIGRVRNHTADVLWPGCMRRFATSAGTTSERKFIPISEAMLRKHLWYTLGAAGCYRRETKNRRAFLGFPVSLGGRVEDDPEYTGNRVGEISGLLAEYWWEHGKLPKFLKRRRNLPGEIRNISDWNEKLDRIADFTMHKDVRMAAMTPSWGLGLFERLIERYNDQHGRRVTTVGEIWPNLQLVITGAVPLRTYRHALEERIGLPRIDFRETYGASEAFFAFQSSQDDPALLLHLDNGVFFEFVRLDEMHGERPRRYTVADVEVGVSYTPYISTNSGLWAYGMGDILQFTSVFPHKVLVMGRSMEMLDSYGEFVRGEQLRDALLDACTRTQSQATEFHLVPKPSENNEQHAHEWLIEFARPPHELCQFARLLDERLKQLNPEYAWCRREKGFGPPHVVPLPSGTFVKCLRNSRADFGVQTKVPCLSDNRDLADRVLQMLNSN